MNEDNFKTFQRDSNRISVSEFYEGYQLKKYNFNPPYQRNDNIWKEKEQSFLIDTIMKNFPMPPIFLLTKIENRQSTYDVVDGKQRLTSIINFIENKIKLPNDFSNDVYGHKQLDGLKLSNIEELANSGNNIANEYINNFWKYKISVEYIENPNNNVVDTIFDRLNRGGYRLSSPELRKAIYHNTKLYNLIIEASNLDFWSNMFNNISSIDENRYDNLSFISELIFLILENKIILSTEDEIDKLYKKWIDKIDEKKYSSTIKIFKSLTKNLQLMNIQYDKYSVRGVSHIYALWAFILFIERDYTNIDFKIIGSRINSMYSDLRNKNYANEYLEEYRNSMQSSSRSLSQRRRRIKAIGNYIKYPLKSNID